MGANKPVQDLPMWGKSNFICVIHQGAQEMSASYEERQSGDYEKRDKPSPAAKVATFYSCLYEELKQKGFSEDVALDIVKAHASGS